MKHAPGACIQRLLVLDSIPHAPLAVRWMPSTTVPVARAAAGILLALGCPLGWAILRVAQGMPLRTELATHAGVYTYMLVSTAIVVAMFGYALGRVEQRLRRANVRLRELANTDDLTLLANARVFHEQLPCLALVSVVLIRIVLMRC